MGTIKGPKKVVSVKGRPLVRPSDDEPKTGCLWCPLLPFSFDFEKYEALYGRNAEKILGKLREPHTVQTRCVCEPPTEVDILIIGTAPGADEDNPKNARPFAGKSGGLLRRTVAEFIDDGVKVGYGNVVSCRPPLNRDPNKTERRSCTPRLLREIHARKPKVIIAAGNIAIEFVAEQSGVTTLHGKVLRCTIEEFKGIPIVASFHPAFILRSDHELDRFVEAYTLANSIVKGEYEFKKGPGEYYVVDEIELVEELLEGFVEDGLMVSYDTETGALSAFQTEYPNILCLSFTNEEGVGYTVPFDHPESLWRPDGPKAKERPRLCAALKKFFVSAVPKVGQNFKFDNKHIRMEPTLGIRVANVKDTMLRHFTIDDRRGTHGLKVLAHVYTGMGGYELPMERYEDKHKEACLHKGGSYMNVPASLLFSYAAMDADAALRVWNAMGEEEEYRENKQFQNLAEVFLPALADTLTDIELFGATMDTSVVVKMEKRLTAEREEFRVEIQKLSEVKRFVCAQREKNADFEFNPGSDSQLREVLFGYYGLKPTELTTSGLKTLGSRLTRLKKQNASMSFKDVIAWSIKHGEWYFYSTKADVLHLYERDGNKLAPLVLKYRHVDTLLTTFVAPVCERLDAESRVHGDFWIGGTVTGRLASSNPNLQNNPPDAKYAYVSRFGDEGVILEVDYSQIEMRMSACWYNDLAMIRAYKQGLDVHTVTARGLYSRSKGLPLSAYDLLSTKEKAEWRTRAKRVNFGVIYGIGVPGLIATLRKEGVFIDAREGKMLIEGFFETWMGLKKGIDRGGRLLSEQGYLDSFSGGRRRIPEVFSTHEEMVSRALRQGVNFPIQRGASDMTLASLILINRAMKERGFRSGITLTVHDSIKFDCHVDEVFEIARIAKDIMENIATLSGDVLPGADWSWLKVPLQVDLKLGLNWGSMVEFEIDAIEAGQPYDGDEPLHRQDAEGLHYRKPANVDELWELMPLVADAA